MTISSWLNFGHPAPPGKGVCGGAKFLPMPYYSQRGLFASKGAAGEIFGSALLQLAHSVCVYLSAFFIQLCNYIFWSACNMWFVMFVSKWLAEWICSHRPGCCPVSKWLAEWICSHRPGCCPVSKWLAEWICSHRPGCCPEILEVVLNCPEIYSHVLIFADVLKFLSTLVNGSLVTNWMSTLAFISA